MSAVENVAVAFVRGRVPEFEPVFRALLEDWGYWELGEIQTFNELARWVLEQPDVEVRTRTFGAVEFVLTEDSMRRGDSEAVEFFETIAQQMRERPETVARVRDASGGATNEWLSRWAQDVWT